MGRWQPERPWIIDEEPGLEKQAIKEEACAHGPVEMATERCEIRAEAEHPAIDAAEIAPAKPAIRAPCPAIPAAELAIAETPVDPAPLTGTKGIATDLAILETVPPPFIPHPVAETPTFCAVTDATVFGAVAATFIPHAIAHTATFCAVADTAVLDAIASPLAASTIPSFKGAFCPSFAALSARTVAAHFTAEHPAVFPNIAPRSEVGGAIGAVVTPPFCTVGAVVAATLGAIGAVLDPPNPVFRAVDLATHRTDIARCVAPHLLAVGAIVLPRALPIGPL